MTRQAKSRKFAFIGRIFKVIAPDKGFIHRDGFTRMDGTDPGLQVDDDIFVHLNAFDEMAKERYFEKPKELRQGMVIAFLIAPSAKQDGRLTAEYCTVYENDK